MVPSGWFYQCPTHGHPFSRMPRSAPSASPGSISAPWPRRAKAGGGFPPGGGHGNLHFRSQPAGGAPPHPSRRPACAQQLWWDLPMDATFAVLPYSFREPCRNPGTREVFDWRASRTTQEWAPHFEDKPRPREGVTFPRSHSERAAEVPQEPALCAPCSAIPLTHGRLESGTLASGYTYEYRGGSLTFCLETRSLPLPLPTPGGPPRRPGLSWRWGTPEARPGTAGLNEACGTLTRLSCWGSGGPRVRPRTQNSSPALGSGRSLKSRVPVSQMGTWTTGRKESLGQAVEVSLSPPLRPTS